MNQATRIHIGQDKNQCFFGIGDVIKVKCSDGTYYEGEIFGIDIKKEGDKLHPWMDIKELTTSHEDETFGQVGLWVENIVELEIQRFKGEK